MRAAVGLLLTLLACAPAAPPQRAAGWAQLRPPPAPAAAEWLEAWTTTVMRERATEAGGWTLEPLSNGGMTAYPAVQRVAGGAGGLADADLGSVVARRLATHPETMALDVSIHVQAGVVTLYGTVDRRAEAAAAVRIALGAPGARAIHSYLRWRHAP